MTDDEIYLACLLAVGPWDWKVEQTEFLMNQLVQKLGRKAELQEAMAFVNGYRDYSRPNRKADTLDWEILAQMIDTHTVGS